MDNDLMLTLVTKGARKLKNTQTLGLQDPYLRAWVTGAKGKQKVRTKTYVDGGSMAVWNESNELKVSNRETDFLLIEVKNENDFTSDTTIGRLKLPCADIPHTPVEDWYSIYGDNGDVAGEVHLSLCIKGKKQESEAPTPKSGDNKLRVLTDRSTSSTIPEDMEFSSKMPKEKDETMPSNWTTHHTSTGCPYYVNEESNVTTWIDPRNL